MEQAEMILLNQKVKQGVRAHNGEAYTCTECPYYHNENCLQDLLIDIGKVMELTPDE